VVLLHELLVGKLVPFQRIMDELRILFARVDLSARERLTKLLWRRGRRALPLLSSLLRLFL